MSRSRVAIAVLVLTAALSTDAPARGRGLFGGSPLGVMRFAVTRLLAPGLYHRHGRHGRMRVREARSSPDKSQEIRDAMTPPPRGAALDGARLFADPAARGQVAATAALALWHGERQEGRGEGAGEGAGGWWSHGHGGYGWVGPLFWPFAYDDIYGHVVSGDTIGFWDYGVRDIYAGLFGPYGTEDLAAYMAQGTSQGAERRESKVPPLPELCGDAGRIAGLPIEKIRQAIQPTDAQAAAMDDLAKASVAAAQLIQASCPTKTVLTAPARLNVMQQRLDAMSKAVISLEWPLEKLYDALSDEQKARLDALAKDNAKDNQASTANEPAKSCEAAKPPPWPADEIEARLHPNDAQRAALKELKRAGAYAADILNYECRPHQASTAPGRLLAVDQRLHDMSQAVNRVSAALEDFYATLSDEQKAQFEAIGPKRTA